MKSDLVALLGISKCTMKCELQQQLEINTKEKRRFKMYEIVF